jgi:3-dehydroquinate dehydratase-1
MDFSISIVASVISVEEAKEALALGADIIETRLDLTDEDPLHLVESIYMSMECRIIATLRPEYEGGKYKGSDEERLQVFKKLIPIVDFIDIELRASNVDDILDAMEGADAVPIVSYHDFIKTPSNEEMLDIIDRASKKGGIAKLAVMPQSFNDVLRLFEVTLISRRPVCTIAMGEFGKHSRIISPVYGSCLTYGYVRKPVAPGQLRVDEIRGCLKTLGLK